MMVKAVGNKHWGTGKGYNSKNYMAHLEEKQGKDHGSVSDFTAFFHFFLFCIDNYSLEWFSCLLVHLNH